MSVRNQEKVSLQNAVSEYYQPMAVTRVKVMTHWKVFFRKPSVVIGRESVCCKEQHRVDGR